MDYPRVVSARDNTHQVTVLSRTVITPHLVRLVLGGDGLAGFTSTGVPDEWVSLVVPGQFQARYYTVRSLDADGMVIDVVVHDEGLVTGWASTDCVGDRPTISDPRSSFALPADAGWLILAGDLTAMPAMARILEQHPGLPTTVLAEVPDPMPDYLPSGEADVHWLPRPGHGSDLAAAVVETPFPEGPGYFWMAGESAQMRAIRKHLMRERKLPSHGYDVMGYWRGVAKRQPRAVDPGPIWRAGKAAGKSDEQIWADYDAARDADEAGAGSGEERGQW